MQCLPFTPRFVGIGICCAITRLVDREKNHLKLFGSVLVYSHQLHTTLPAYRLYVMFYCFTLRKQDKTLAHSWLVKLSFCCLNEL